MSNQRIIELKKMAYQKGFQSELEKLALFGIGSGTFGIRKGIAAAGRYVANIGKTTPKILPGQEATMRGPGGWAARSLEKRKISQESAALGRKQAHETQQVQHQTYSVLSRTPYRSSEDPSLSC